jgi:hypothetical protein
VPLPKRLIEGVVSGKRVFAIAGRLFLCVAVEEQK